MRTWISVLIFTTLGVPAIAQTSAPQPRARDLGLSPIIGGTPGKLDSITDGMRTELQVIGTRTEAWRELGR